MIQTQIGVTKYPIRLCQDSKEMTRAYDAYSYYCYNVEPCLEKLSGLGLQCNKLILAFKNLKENCNLGSFLAERFGKLSLCVLVCLFWRKRIALLIHFADQILSLTVVIVIFLFWICCLPNSDAVRDILKYKHNLSSLSTTFSENAATAKGTILSHAVAACIIIPC